MGISRGQIVRALAGHEKGNLLCVVDVAEDFLLVADGKTRKLAHPKRKHVKHVSVAGETSHPAIQKLCAGIPVSDKALRHALAAFRDTMNGQGGNHAWQKTI